MDDRGVEWQRSPSKEKPVEVRVQVEVHSVNEIDSKTGLATVNLEVYYFWTDARVADAFRQDPQFKIPGNLWKPGLQIAIRPLCSSVVAPLAVLFAARSVVAPLAVLFACCTPSFLLVARRPFCLFALER